MPVQAMFASAGGGNEPPNNNPPKNSPRSTSEEEYSNINLIYMLLDIISNAERNYNYIISLGMTIDGIRSCNDMSKYKKESDYLNSLGDSLNNILPELKNVYNEVVFELSSLTDMNLQ